MHGDDSCRCDDTAHGLCRLDKLVAPLSLLLAWPRMRISGRGHGSLSSAMQRTLALHRSPFRELRLIIAIPRGKIVMYCFMRVFRNSMSAFSRSRWNIGLETRARFEIFEFEKIEAVQIRKDIFFLIYSLIGEPRI